MKFPNGLCTRCRKLLQKIDLPNDDKNKKEVSDLPDPVDFSKLKFPTITRSSGSLHLAELTNCSCDLCNIATQKVAQSMIYAGGSNTGPHPIGRPPSQNLPRLPQRKPITICERCELVLTRGITHPKNCGLKDRRENHQKLGSVDPIGQEIAAGNLIKEKIKLAEASGTSKVDSQTVPLATASGKSFQVETKPKTSTSRALFHDKPLPAEEWAKIANQAGLSGKQRRSIETGIRPLKGGKFFEPYIETKIKIATREGSEFYAIAKVRMDRIGGKPGEKWETTIFYCKDLPGLTAFIEEKRGYHSQIDRIHNERPGAIHI